jgi:hypothetical protein
MSTPLDVVTTIVTAPAVPAGVITVIEVSLTTVSEVPAFPPKVTDVAPVNRRPVIVTVVPPVVDPVAGRTLVTDGTLAIGVTEVLADDAEESPVAFLPITVNVYAVPFVRPVTEQVVEAVVQVNPPGSEVTTYVAEFAEAVQLTCADSLPAVAVTPVGVEGSGRAGVTAVLALEAEELPVVFLAITVNV